jgi:myo-inositol-1(or 4)-monophosphatase
LANNFGILKNQIFKSGHDLVTEMDKKSEEIIIKKIVESFPNHSIFAEESGMKKNDSEYCWYIDPLDGTNNYAAGIAYFSISIALVKGDETIIGVIYNPITKQKFSAVKGQGAFLNGKTIFPSEQQDLSKGVLSFVRGHMTYDGGILESNSKEIQQLLIQKFRRTITMWAPALDWCLLAAGGIDALVSFVSELEDQYAGTLICQEAGVNVVSFDGKEYDLSGRKIIAANENISQQLINILSAYQNNVKNN